MNDEYDAFGTMLAAKLRRLGSLDRKAYLGLEMKINTLVNKYELSRLSSL